MTIVNLYRFIVLSLIICIAYRVNIPIIKEVNVAVEVIKMDTIEVARLTKINRSLKKQHKEDGLYIKSLENNYKKAREMLYGS